MVYLLFVFHQCSLWPIFINPNENIWLWEIMDAVVILADKGLKLWFYLSFISKICPWACYSFEVIPQYTRNQYLQIRNIQIWKCSPCCLSPLCILSFTPADLIKLSEEIMRNVFLIIIFCSKNKLHPLWWGIWRKIKISSPKH